MDIVTHVVKFNGQTAGRDKIYRLVQYIARFLKWYWSKHGVSKSLLLKCQSLENALSMARKAMRLGKSIDVLQSALANANLSDKAIRLCLVLGKLSQACFLFVDNVLWASKLGLLAGVDAAKLNRISARLWMVSIAAGIARDIVDITRITCAELKKQRQRDTSDGTDRVVGIRRRRSYSDIAAMVMRILAHRPLLVDTTKNVADFFLPAATLGYVPTSDGFQGLMGIISSYMGILSIWDPALKLSP